MKAFIQTGHPVVVDILRLFPPRFVAGILSLNVEKNGLHISVDLGDLGYLFLQIIELRRQLRTTGSIKSVVLLAFEGDVRDSGSSPYYLGGAWAAPVKSLFLHFLPNKRLHNFSYQ